ncbi:MAG: FHA domain-containing protein [Bacteroidales bacterium]|nr:FHA domain-containing protein [Bacteroidales bacterium]
MKHFLSLLIVFISFSVYAQQGSLRGDIEMQYFPEVSFIWNEYNPEPLHPNQFSLKENGAEVAFRCENVLADIPERNKSVLFLWEYQPNRQDQFAFAAELLYYFFKEDVVSDKTTMFNIAVFNRKQGDEPALKGRLQEFTSDKEVLQTALAQYSDYRLGTVSYPNKPDKSDLFLAVKEGLDLIEKEPKSNTRAIFVITAGQYVPDVEMSPIVNQALLNKIPVYTVYYPLSKSDNYSVIAYMSQETYGQFILSDGSSEATRGTLLSRFNDLNRRHYGQDYKITFVSSLKRDGASYPLVLNSKGTDYNIMPYKTPEFSFIGWVKDCFRRYLIVSLIVLMVTVALITFGIIFAIRFFRRRKNRKAARKQQDERQKAQLSAEQESLKRKLSATQDEFQRRQRAAEQEKKQAQEEEQEERLTQLMHTKNLLPRLISVNDGVIYHIGNATSTLGRGDDNDVVIADPTVSKHHAQIVFNGVCFEIYDLNSSNGIIVNGEYIESAELKSSDVIQLGEVAIKFYL